MKNLVVTKKSIYMWLSLRLIFFCLFLFLFFLVFCCCLFVNFVYNFSKRSVPSVDTKVVAIQSYPLGYAHYCMELVLCVVARDSK